MIRVFFTAKFFGWLLIQEFADFSFFVYFKLPCLIDEESVNALLIKFKAKSLKSVSHLLLWRTSCSGTVNLRFELIKLNLTQFWRFYNSSFPIQSFEWHGREKVLCKSCKWGRRNRTWRRYLYLQSSKIQVFQTIGVNYKLSCGNSRYTKYNEWRFTFASRR